MAVSRSGVKYLRGNVLRWFPSWTGQGTEPASRWRVDGDEGVSAVDGAAEGWLLLQLIRGERKLVDVCREHDLKQSEVEGWMDTFVKAGERGLKARAEDEQAVHEAEVRELREKIGELVLALDARKKLAALSGKPETAF